MIARITSLAVTPGASVPSTRDAHASSASAARGICVASTCSTSRGADAEGERAERAVRGGVRVAADESEPGLRDALLGADDVHDALPRIVGAEERDARARAVWRSSASTMSRISGSAIALAAGRVGT